MDYQGQSRCESVYEAILILSAILGYAYGWYQQSFYHTFLICVAGFVIACLVCVPDWPFYNRNPLPFQAACLLPGAKDAEGKVVLDTNRYCGTCVCGANVHGIQCESHEYYKTKPGDTAASTPAAASAPAAVDDAAAESAPQSNDSKQSQSNKSKGKKK